VGPVGKADYAKQVQSRIRELDLPVNVEGVLDEKALKLAYAASRILVMPSRPHASSIEGLGLALLEAAHFGCAVIGSRVGGIPEALRDGETGLLVPPDDPEALAAALARLLSDKHLAARMGAAGAAFVRNTFSWDRNARILMGAGVNQG
jgi:phosphatidylinositol alpha-1,6-mannosyltransferase